MELKPGYKQTQAGAIPEAWSEKPVKEFAVVRGGKRLPLGKGLIDTPTAHPYVRVTDMRMGSVDLANIKYVPADVFPAIKNYRIYCSDIFISVAGTLGIAGKVPVELDGANLTENADRITDIQCDQDFLLYNLMSSRIQGLIDSARTVGAQPKLALGRIEAFPIGLPPTIEEQRAIAAALSDVDALIGALDKLIAKKRGLKQATMQQLLTGQTRLPGLSGEWEVRRLGDLLSVRHGKNQSGVVVRDGKYPILATGGEIGRTNTCLYDRPSVLIGRKGTIDKPQYRDEPFWTVDTLFYTEIGPASSAKFLFYKFEMIDWRSYNEASGVPSLNASTIENIEIGVPGLKEQTAIATVLSDMDAELAALEARRDKTRALKQGMMQELLTGRIRLV